MGDGEAKETIYTFLNLYVDMIYMYFREVE
jgi:hypothetical protein